MFEILTKAFNQKQFSLKSEGHSMRPILNSGDIIYYQKSQFKQTKLNDILLIKKNNKLFTHRVIYKTAKYLITKGDNNLESDGKIYPRHILAKAYKLKRNGQIFDLENIYLLQSTLYFQEIIKIKKAFEKANIDFVFLKGLPLHLYFEKRQPNRIYADCDILIAREYFDAAEKILIKHGFNKADDSLSKIQKSLKDKETECSYYKVINGLMVVFDLHLEVVFMMTQLGRLEALYPQKLIDKLTKEFLKEKQIIKTQNESFPILSNKHLIIYLALHFFHHNYHGAFRLEFLHRIIVRACREHKNTVLLDGACPEALEWARRIKEYKLQNFIYPVFFLLKKYYQTPLPRSFLQTIKPVGRTIKQYSNINIFDDEPRIKAGINRFKNIFLLSFSPLPRKILVFLNFSVIYLLFLVSINKLKRFFKF